jgi:hypothetical protein
MILKQKAKDHVQELTHLIKSALGSIGNKMRRVSTIFGSKNKKDHNEIVKRMSELNCSSEHVVNSILALMVGATVEMSLGMFFPF